MKTTLILIALFFAPVLRAQKIQCPLRWMYQYVDSCQHEAGASVDDDSALAYLIATLKGYPFAVTSSVGWSVDDADSFAVHARTTDSVLVTIQHDDPFHPGAFIEDTTFVGPFYWRLLTVPVTPGAHNYSMMLYPSSENDNKIAGGQPRRTVFDRPVYFGAAYQWSATAGVRSAQNASHVTARYFDVLGRVVPAQPAVKINDSTYLVP